MGVDGTILASTYTYYCPACAGDIDVRMLVTMEAEHPSNMWRHTTQVQITELADRPQLHFTSCSPSLAICIFHSASRHNDCGLGTIFGAVASHGWARNNLVLTLCQLLAGVYQAWRRPTLDSSRNDTFARDERCRFATYRVC